jgi:hypothetical protein
MNSENSDSWGANGLGYWLTPQLLWDVDAVKCVDELFDDFLQNAFGSAKQPMCEFYMLLSRDKTVRSDEDMIARMYRRLDAAQRMTDDETVCGRIADLVLYTRYLELYRAYRAAEGDRRQVCFEAVCRHVYRMRDRFMVSTRAICQKDRFRDRSVTVPEQAAWDVPTAENPWKNDTPFTEDEIAVMLAEGIAANKPTELDFEPVDYSTDLIPATSLDLTEVEPGYCSDQFRGRQTVFTWLPDDSDEGEAIGRRTISLEVTGGLISHYRDRGNVHIELYAAREATLLAVDQDQSVPPDGQPRQVTLRSPYGGLHRIEWTDGQDMTRITRPKDCPWTFRSSLDEPLQLRGRWSLYFFVPHGTRKVGGFSTATTGQLLDGGGNTVFSFEEMDEPDYFSVTVPEGQDGVLWQFANCTGSRMLMTTPPYLATRVCDLLLPREVVSGDATP